MRDLSDSPVGARDGPAGRSRRALGKHSVICPIAPQRSKPFTKQRRVHDARGVATAHMTEAGYTDTDVFRRRCSTPTATSPTPINAYVLGSGVVVTLAMVKRETTSEEELLVVV